MEICHPHCIEILQNFLPDKEQHSRHRALDVGGGDGRITQHFLTKEYQRVDLFDQCPKAIKKAKKAMDKNVAFGYAEEATMENFKWEFTYSAIYMVWVSGYLNDMALTSFLRRAKMHLIILPFRREEDGSRHRSSSSSTMC